MKKAIFIPYQKKLLKIQKFDGSLPVDQFWKPVPHWVRYVILVIALPLIVLLFCFIFIKGFIYWILYNKNKSKEVMQKSVDALNNLSLVKPTPNILYKLKGAKALGYQIIIYHSATNLKCASFKRGLFKHTAKPEFDSIIEANNANDILDFARDNNIALDQSLFIKSKENNIQDLDLKRFASNKLLANAW